MRIVTSLPARLAFPYIALSFALSLAACAVKPVPAAEAQKVVDALDTGSASAQASAKRRLEMSQPIDIWPALVRLFSNSASTSPASRIYALELISPRTTYYLPLPPPLAYAVAGDPDLGVRRASLKAVLALGNPEHMPYLVDASRKESDPALKAELEQILVPGGKWTACMRGWHRNIVKFPPNDDKFVYSARAIAKTGEPQQDVPLLIEAYQAASTSLVRYEVILAVSALGGSEANDFVLPLVGSPDPFLRTAAIFGESHLKDPRAIPGLKEILMVDTLEDMRVNAARSLASIGGPEARTALTQACEKNKTTRAKTACSDAKKELAKAKPAGAPG